MSENGLAHLESMLQELTRCEQRKMQQIVEDAFVNSKHKSLDDQLKQTREELEVAQASKATMCEEVGTLMQAKEHQAKQLDKYKFNLQTARESQATMMKKMEELQASTSTIKQQYIRSLAIRIKTSALVLQQLNVANGTSFSARLAEQCSEWEQGKPNKRKRFLAVEDEQQRGSEDGGKPKHTGAVEVEFQPQDEQRSVVDRVVAVKVTNAVALVEQHQTLPIAAHSAKKSNEQEEEDRAESKREIAELQVQISSLEAKYSTLKDKYKTLVRDHDEALDDRTTYAHDIAAKDAKIEGLMQELELTRSKQRDAPAIEDNSKNEDKGRLEERVKILEESLTQMNGYADQLEMVIGQCPSCTAKLQSESTQDSK